MIGTVCGMTRGQKSAVLWAVVMALCAGFVAGYAACAVVQREATYIEKLMFCHDRMKNKDVLVAWKMRYCKAPVLDAIDPITGRPVAGIVEGER